MKSSRIITVFVFFIMVLSASSQISEFKFKSMKEYSDGRMIAHFNLDSFKNIDEATYVKQKIVNENNIIRFKTSKNNFNMCLIETNAIMKEETLTILINDIINEYNKEILNTSK